MELLQLIESTTVNAEQVAARTAQIHANALSKSKYLSVANFTKIHPADLELLFSEYDAAFFGGEVRKALGATPLRFALSNRMTSSGGTTTHYKKPILSYKITISTTILFGCFRDNDHRPIAANGIVCRDRLDAMQRVLEHEMVHLIESHLWEISSCSQPRFLSIARRFFGHTEHKHKLITPRERAIVQYGIRPGMKVRFRFDGEQRVGIVNRVNNRATVLVEDERGQRYTNGKHYAKFYVPVQQLEAVE